MGKLLVLVSAVVVALVSVPASASAEDEGSFNAACRFSHRAADDPIVHPRHPGAAHMHDFIGNTSTNSRSTARSLRGSPALCSFSGDRSAWWVPTLYENGHALAPDVESTYYRTGGRAAATIDPFPAGLRVIAGNANATGPQDEDVVRWECTEDKDMVLPDPTAGFVRRRARRRATLDRLRRSIRALRRSSGRRNARALGRLRGRLRALRMNPVIRGGLPLCGPGKVVSLSIEFPECWDGKRLDSPDHQAHMTFSVHRGEGPRACPGSHPRAVPDVSLHLRYPTRGGPAVQLASGREWTAHGDFFNGWNPGRLAELVQKCLKTPGSHC